MAKDHWMQDAVKPENKGKFSAKAEKAGKSTAEYAREKADAPGKLGKEARLAETFEKFGGKAKGGEVKHEAKKEDCYRNGGSIAGKKMSKRGEEAMKKATKKHLKSGGKVAEHESKRGSTEERDEKGGRTRATDEQEHEGYAKGGAIRGMGAAIRGKGFSGEF